MPRGEGWAAGGRWECSGWWVGRVCGREDREGGEIG